MTNVNNIPCKEIRKESWNNLCDGKWGKAALSMLVYCLLFWVMALVSKFIPLIGSIALIVISPVLTYGFLVEMIKLKNGEDYSYVDFFKFGFEKFSMVWKVALRVMLKMIVPIIITVIGVALVYSSAILKMVTAMKIIQNYAINNTSALESRINMTETDIGRIYETPTVEKTETNAVISIIAIALTMIGYILIIVGSIISIPISYKYKLVNLEIYNNPNAEHSKDLINRAEKLMVGHRFKFFVLELSFIGWLLLGALGCGIPLLWITPFMEVAKLVFYDKLVEGENNTTVTVDPNPIV